jgi:hypothetical protein
MPINAPVSTPASTPTTPAVRPTQTPKKKTELDEHNELKASIIIGAVAGFGVFKYFTK